MVIGWREFDDTFRAFNLLQRGFDRVFDDWAGAPLQLRARAELHRPWPPIDAYETKEGYVYKVEAPGLTEGEVAVTVEDETLVLRGERKSDVPEGYEVRQRERPTVSFVRKLPLPGRVDAEAVTATMKDGILTVTLPKAKETLPRRIAVKVT